MTDERHAFPRLDGKREFAQHLFLLRITKTNVVEADFAAKMVNRFVTDLVNGWF